MKLCRFDDNRMGVVEGDVVKDVTQVLDRLPSYRVPLPRFDPVIEQLDTLRPALEEAAARAEGKPVSSVKLLSPVANPGKVVAAPVNYTKHLDEATGDPALHHGNQINQIQRAGLFLKSPHSVIAPSDTVKLRHTDRRNDHEVELVAIIGKTANNVSEADALNYVAGYCIGLDMTLRGPEERSFRKSIDTYTVLGPWMVTADEFGDPSDVELKIDVDGESRQHARTKDLILNVRQLIAFATAFYTLYPGDVLMTGTPEGVAPVVAGNTMNATIERIGSMQVKVEAA